MRMKSNRTRIYADMTLLGVAIIWGTTFMTMKSSLNSLTPFYIMAIRFLLAFVIMAVVFHKKAAAVRKADLIGGAVAGIVLFFAFAIQTIGLIYTTAGKQAFLAGTYVVLAPFLYWLVYKKKPDIRSFAGAVICFAGIGLLTMNASLGIGRGDGLTLFSSLLFAGHIIATGYYVEKMDAVILTILQFGIVGVLSLFAALISAPLPVDVPVGVFVPVLYLAVFGTCIAYFLQTIAQKYTISTHAAIIMSTESLFGSTFSVLFMGDVFTLKMVIGCAAIFAAILITELRRETNEPA